ncbi:MAG: DUF4215 domain-containing protein [Deltaproteobacteria bacterium]|nr:DUF4215 domain-containing protein [Deltaproteobacteria bacterium]
MKRTLLLWFLGVVPILFTPLMATATTISVTAGQEVPPQTNGNCALNEAFLAANDDVAVDACPAGSGADIIQLQAGTTYTLAKPNGWTQPGLPMVTAPLTVEGNGATIVRESETKFQLLRIYTDGVTLKGLTLRSGQAIPGWGGAILFGSQGLLTLVDVTVADSWADRGGAIFAQGDLSLTRTTLTANKANVRGGAIHHQGTLVMSDSTIESNEVVGSDFGGGGVYSENTVIITGSILAGNSSGGTGGALTFWPIAPGKSCTVTGSSVVENFGQSGGGLYLRPGGGTVTITESDISGNIVQGGGGGIKLYAPSLAENNTVTIANSTIAGNVAAVTQTGGGIFNAGVAVTLINATVTQNQAELGAGLYQSETEVAKFHNVLLLNNVLYTGVNGDCFQGGGGGIFSLGHNLVGTTCQGFTPEASDQVPEDPSLAGVGNYFPSPEAGKGHCLLGDASLALNAGDTTRCTDAGDLQLSHDQIGQARNGACDIGAIEAVCGDEILHVSLGEVCDDGNAVGGDGCSGDCSKFEVCGDDTLDGGEACDDGNTAGGDGCSADCLKIEICGDAFPDTGEICDDGNTISGDGCRADCAKLEICGDAVLDAGEACDDGNQKLGDGCNKQCQLEICGDGKIDRGEKCDDGNTVGGDGCSANCKKIELCGDSVIDMGEACDDGNQVNTDACPNSCQSPQCGDGIVQQNGIEACDDGNQVNTDACLNNCILAACGDGVLQSGVETCDDGNTVSGDGCRADCLKTEVCGDGLQDAGEACDDGNSVQADACLNNCILAACGDGIVRAGIEQCDDANPDNTDPCIDTCKTAACGDGFIQKGVESCDDGNADDGDACPGNCLLDQCGDGVISVGEACDDGNAAQTDACLNSCVAATCGDGVLQTGVESCDDGNVVGGDGCSSACVTEGGAPTQEDENGTAGDASTENGDVSAGADETAGEAGAAANGDGTTDGETGGAPTDETGTTTTPSETSSSSEGGSGGGCSLMVR